MLSGSCLGDDAGLAHALGKEDRGQSVVDLMGSGVVEVFAFEIDVGAVMCTQTIGPVKRRGASHVVAEQGVELAVEVVVGRITVEGFAEPLDVAVKYLGDVGSAEVSVVALVVDRENGVKLFHMMSVFFLLSSG